MVFEMHDKQILSRIAGGDLVLLKAQYHFPDLTNFRNKYGAKSKNQKRITQSRNNENKIKESIVFEKIAAYMEIKITTEINFF
jgi:hypothetical protein